MSVEKMVRAVRAALLSVAAVLLWAVTVWCFAGGPGVAR